MQENPKRVGRFFSAPQGHNQSYVSEDSDNMKPVPRPSVHFQPGIKDDHTPKKNFLRRISSVAEEKIDDSEEDAQRVSEALQDFRSTRITSIFEDESNNKDIVISSIAPATLVDTDLTFHRDLKPGRQWFRWNLLFNLLLWLVVPLPFWIPFVSNTVAYYMIPSIQGVFVAMWTSECALSLIFQIALSFV
jgi:hypothetical protein